MNADVKKPRPIAVLPVDDYDQEQALDWVAPEDDSRVRIFLFKFLPVLFLCLFAYWPAWKGDFVWQDDIQVTANNPLRSAAGLGMVWANPSVTPQWAPAAYSFLFPQHLIWQDKTPIGYHLVNLLVHTCNVMLLWMILKRLEIPGPFVAALVFALHPMQTEAVGWIARQPLLFGAMWGLCFTVVYYRWSGADPTVPNPSRIFRLPEGPKKLYALAVIVYAIALMSAPLAVCTIPLVMGVVLWWKMDGLDRKNRLGLVPFVVMAAGVVIFNATIEQRHGEANWPLNLVVLIQLVGRSVWFFVHQFFWSTDLTVIHKNWPLGGGDLLSWLILAGVLVVAIGLWVRRREIGRAPIAAVGVYLLLLLPMITPINRAAIHNAYVSERFQYLACGAMAAAVIAGIATLARPIVRDARWPAPTAVAAMLIALSFTTFFGHANSFASPVALWENTANKDDDNIPAMIHLAQVYEKEKDGLPKAINLYQRILRLTDRKNVDALLGLGTLVEKNDMDEAAGYYKEAMAASPDRTDAIRDLGQLWVKQKKTDDAIDLYRKAIARSPNDDTLYHQLGRAQTAKGDLDGAILSFNKSIELNGFDANTRIDLATSYFAKKDMADAGKQIQKAFDIDPNSYDLRMNLGEMCVLSNDWDNAYIQYRIASILKTDSPEPCSNVGFVLTKQSIGLWQRGQPQLAKDKIKEAIVYFKRALELNPDFESAKKNLKTAQMIQSQVLNTAPPTTRPTTRSATQPSAAH